MSKRMKNTYIWTTLAIFTALVLSAPGIVPSFFERIGVIVLCAPWLIGAWMEKEKKAWRRFYIVLACGVLLAAITYFTRMNLNSENTIPGMIVILIVANLQRLYSFVLAICAMVILWKTRKQELAVREEKLEQKEWVNNRFTQREKAESLNADISNQAKQDAPVKKGRTLDL